MRSPVSPAYNTDHITFPPTQIPAPPSLSSSPSSMASRAAANALNRAISIASKKLFGNVTQTRRSSSKDFQTSAPSSPRRPIISLDTNARRDPIEDGLLATLEELAQKTEVLTHWADEMYEYVKAIPQSMFLMDIISNFIDLSQNLYLILQNLRSGRVRRTSRPENGNMPIWRQKSTPSLAWRSICSLCRFPRKESINCAISKNI